MSVLGVVLVRIFVHLAWIRRYTDQNNSEYGHFLRSTTFFSSILHTHNPVIDWSLQFSTKLFSRKLSILLFYQTLQTAYTIYTKDLQQKFKSEKEGPAIKALYEKTEYAWN